MTTDSRTDGATILSHMNVSGNIGHVTTFSWMVTITRCLVVGQGQGQDQIQCLVGYWLRTRICPTFRCHCYPPVEERRHRRLMRCNDMYGTRASFMSLQDCH